MRICFLAPETRDVETRDVETRDMPTRVSGLKCDQSTELDIVNGSLCILCTLALRAGSRSTSVRDAAGTRESEPALPETAEKNKVWVARKSFHLCRLKNHKNLKPQPERKTSNERSNLWEIIVSKDTRYHIVYPLAFERHDIDRDLNPRKYASR